jgi:hypothetical protein
MCVSGIQRVAAESIPPTDPSEIPDEVIDFIARRIDSVPHLEALLLLWEHDSKVWTRDEVARRVYVSHERAGEILRDLAQHGLISVQIEPTQHYRYEATWDVAGLMSEVASAYRRQLVPISTFIHVKAASGAVKGFASAFKFRKKD